MSKETQVCEETISVYESYNLKYYTKNEELWNFATHLVGALLAIVGGIFAIFYLNSVLDIIATLILCFSCLLVYGVSAAYHGVKSLKQKSLLRRIDHADISFIIIGCGAPVCLCVSSIWINFVGFGLCLLLATIGASLCIKNLKKYQTLALVFDFIVGGILTFVFWVNKDAISYETIIYYASGLGLCLLGAVLYLMKRKYVHTIFHVFMVCGTIVFYFGTLKLLM